MKELTHKEYRALPIEEKRKLTAAVAKRLRFTYDKDGDGFHPRNLEYQAKTGQWYSTNYIMLWQQYQYRIKPKGVKWN